MLERVRIPDSPCRIPFCPLPDSFLPPAGFPLPDSLLLPKPTKHPNICLEVSVGGGGGQKGFPSSVPRTQNAFKKCEA